MKLIFTSILLHLLSFCFAQFAIVNDTDSLVNVREDTTTNSKILDKLENGYLLHCFEKQDNWLNIDYTKNDEYRNGYVYKDKLKMVSDFTPFVVSSKSENTITLKKDTLQVTITQSNFDKKKHTFTYYKDHPTHIELIDNNHIWGTDGNMPKTQFEDITIQIGEKTITLPISATIGLYEPNICSAKVNYDELTHTIYIQTSNSDGAGGYLVLWKIVNGTYIERFIAYGF